MAKFSNMSQSGKTHGKKQNGLTDVQSKKRVVKDARERLVKISKSSGVDARDKIVKLQREKKGELAVTKTAGGRVTKVKTVGGKLVLKTNKNSRAELKRASQNSTPRLATVSVRNAKKLVNKARNNAVASNIGQARVSGRGAVTKVSRIGRKDNDRRTVQSAGREDTNPRQSSRTVLPSKSTGPTRRPVRRNVNSAELFRRHNSKIARNERSPISGHPLDRFDVKEPRSHRVVTAHHDVPNQFRSGRPDQTRAPMSDAVRMRDSTLWGGSNRSAARSYDVDSTSRRMYGSGIGDRLSGPPLRSEGAVVVVSNLRSTVSRDDIVELFTDIGPVIRVSGLHRGSVDVVFENQADARRSVQVYHNRQLDGCAMRCLVLESDRDDEVLRHDMLDSGRGGRRLAERSYFD